MAALLLALACAPTTGGGDSGDPWPGDDDHDGWTRADGDCDDADPLRFPGRAEVCNGVDDDCDGVVDDGVLVTGYYDADSDGHGATAPTSRACTLLPGYAPTDGDCNDADASVHPLATEVCNDLDDDCDGEVDDDDPDLDPGSAATFYVDADGDGYGADPVVACDPPDGTTSTPGDCDDADDTTFPGAPETCDESVDHNCDGSVGFADADADGWAACLECNDADPDVSPGATEVCNGADDDCDGVVDDADPSLDLATASAWYRDADGDGHGDGDAVSLACEPPAGHVDTPGDCDDATDTTFPGAAETCNEVDDDCDGATDVGSTDAPTWYADADGDGYGNAASTLAACEQPAGHVSDATDCDDTDATVNPGARETCNEVDDDCDGAVDSGTGAWSDDFDDGDISDWTVVDGGWSVSGGIVTGYSISHVGPDFIHATPMTGREDNYTLHLRAAGNHDFGLVLAYAGSSDYCGFHFLQGLDLYLTTGNNVEEIVGAVAYDPLTYYDVRAELGPEHVDLYFDGVLVYSDDASCDDFVRTGQVGLQVHQDQIGYFDGVCVEW